LIFCDCLQSSDHLYFVQLLFFSFLGRRLCLLYPLLVSILLPILSVRSSMCLFFWLLMVIGFFIATPLIRSPELFLFFVVDCGHFLKKTSKWVSSGSGLVHREPSNLNTLLYWHNDKAGTGVSLRSGHWVNWLAMRTTLLGLTIYSTAQK